MIPSGTTRPTQGLLRCIGRSDRFPPGERNISDGALSSVDEMRRVGVLISDAKLLFELIEALRAEDIPFELEDPKAPSHDIEVLLTTGTDKPADDYGKSIICSLETIHRCVKEAKAVLRYKGKIKSLIVGIDPGSTPGIAVLADHLLIDSAAVKSPEEVVGLVSDYTKVYPSNQVLVRIGNGDRTVRNRIFNSIWDLGIPIEIVDESNTSTKSDQKDIDAAIEIALTSGYRPVKKQPVTPSEGEIADIQRKSRIGSNGELTISRSLAGSVAKGEMSMEKAIEQQKSSKKDRKNGG
jgi:hypothetical protein